MPFARVAMISALVAALLVLLAVALPGTAGADGDPASDVLAQERVFLPADAGVSAGQQRLLNAVVADANRRGVPIRVAVISSASDLGSISALWGQPQAYAKFLGTELSLLYKGRLLVVMPSGFGLYTVGSSASAQPTVPPALAHGSARGVNLATAAANAVRTLALAAGHPLSQVPSAGSARRTGSTAASSAVPWIVLGVGGAMIVLAWTASFLAVPLRWKTRGASAESRT